MITLRRGKITKEDIEATAASTEVLINLPYTFPNVNDWMLNFTHVKLAGGSPLIYNLHGDTVIKSFGVRPSCVIHDYDSSPGVWVVDDTETGIVWYVYSDLYRKKHFKGTSYELQIPDNVTEDQLILAISKFFKQYGLK